MSAFNNAYNTGIERAALYLQRKADKIRSLDANHTMQAYMLELVAEEILTLRKELA